MVLRPNLWRRQLMAWGRNPAATSKGIVVALVVVHLLGRAEAEPEGGKFEEPLPTPGRDVDDARAAGAQDPVELGERCLRLREMLENGEAQDDIERRRRDLFECPRQRADDGRDLRILRQVLVDGYIGQSGTPHLGQHRPDDAGVESAPEVADVEAVERPDGPADTSARKPYAQSIDEGRRPGLPKGFCSHERSSV